MNRAGEPAHKSRFPSSRYLFAMSSLPTLIVGVAIG